MSNTVDYIIVGQGLIGSLLAIKLLDKGKRIIVFDNGHKSASSKVAAGIINPITGRKYVKSWMIDQLLPVALKTYQEISSQLNIEILHTLNVIRSLNSVREENDWEARLGDPEYQAYMAQSTDFSPGASLEASLAYGEITKAYRIDLPLFIATVRKKLIAKGLLITEEFDHNALVLGSTLAYKQVQSRNIVFCEGAKVADNPLFCDKDWRPVKGEILIIHAPDLQLQKNLRHNLFITPLGEHHYWVGANYIKDFEDDEPTQAEYTRLLEMLKKIVKTDFEVIDHLAGIRPATKSRRPILGRHTDHDNIFLINGMGAKGASLGPYWVNQFIRTNCP